MGSMFENFYRIFILQFVLVAAFGMPCWTFCFWNVDIDLNLRKNDYKVSFLLWCRSSSGSEGQCDLFIIFWCQSPVISYFEKNLPVFNF